MKKVSILIFAIFLLVSMVRAEESGRYFMTFYTSEQTGGHFQNWSIIQDDRGVMYIGNGYGILEYDGSTWRLIPNTNKSFATSFAKDSTGRIYVGCAAEFGYLEPDSKGDMQFISLLEQIPGADSIVKSMLQHSLGSTGQKQPTDINNLTDEFFRLAYHGLRAKDKSFQANMKTDFDSSLGKVNVVSQDIGRVVLNLISNAFYAVTERKKLNQPDYEPTVWVSTKKVNGKIQISVKDNGIGIPQKILDKIFQPFFTTKPAGEGTGLGLSLAYDIVTKGHGGELKVETREGEGSTFIIQIPC